MHGFRHCPLAHELVASSLDRALMRGVWYEHAYIDSAEVGACSPTFNFTVDGSSGVLAKDSHVQFGQRPSIIVEHYEPASPAASGVFAKHVDALFGIPGGSVPLENCALDSATCSGTVGNAVGRCVMVVFTTTDLRANVKSVSKETQMHALQSYAALGWKSGEQDIGASVDVFGGKDACVRAMAVDSLSAMITPGNDFAMRSVCKAIDHRYPNARCAAVNALVRISPQGHKYTVDCLLGRLFDDSSRVRRCKEQALPQVIAARAVY